MDEYDLSVNNFDEIINIYNGEEFETVITNFMTKIKSSTKETSIEINYQTFHQIEEN